MFNKYDLNRNAYQLFGGQAKQGYDWWWHSFTGYHHQTGKPRAFFIEFFLCNPDSGKEEPVYGQLKENKENHICPSYLMIKVGSWGENKKQLHQFYGWKKIKVNKGIPFEIQTEDCYLTEDRTYGKVVVNDSKNHPEKMCDDGTFEWDLKIDKQITYNVGYGASTLFRKLQLFEMFWHVQGMKTKYEGTITYDGELYDILPDKSYGYADKNWGKDFTSPWVWLSSNNLTSLITNKKLNNSAFDIGGGKPKVGPIVLNRQLLSAFYYEGKELEFNFSKFWTHCKTQFESHETEDKIIWHVEQSTWNNKMVTDIECLKKDMLFVNYEAPNGLKRYSRLWNGGNGKGIVCLYHKNQLIDKIQCENVGCEYGEFDK